MMPLWCVYVGVFVACFAIGFVSNLLINRRWYK